MAIIYMGIDIWYWSVFYDENYRGIIFISIITTTSVF